MTNPNILSSSNALPAAWQPSLPVTANPGGEWFSAYIDEAAKQVESLPFPEKSDENWRWVDFSGIDLEKLRPHNGAKKSLGNDRALFLRLGGKSIGDDPSLNEKGVVFAPLSRVLRDQPDLLDDRLGALVPASESRYAALASQFGLDGLVLFVPRDTRLEQALTADLISGYTGEAHFTHTLIWLEEGSSCSLFLNFDQAKGEETDALHAGLVEIHLGVGATLALYETQSLGNSVWNVTHERAVLEKDSRLTWLYTALGSRMSKNFLNTDLRGEGASAELKGAFVSSESRMLDLDTQQNHLAPQTTSNLLYKGAASGNGRAVWEGMIYVAPNAQLTDGYQANRNLVLDEKAVIRTIPGLEICADNVRCSHGATVGSLDPEELFYLRTRGIPMAGAEQMLVEGFFAGVLDALPTENLKKDISSKIMDKLRNKSNRSEKM